MAILNYEFFVLWFYWYLCSLLKFVLLGNLKKMVCKEKKVLKKLQIPLICLWLLSWENVNVPKPCGKPLDMAIYVHDKKKYLDVSSLRKCVYLVIYFTLGIGLRLLPSAMLFHLRKHGSWDQLCIHTCCLDPCWSWEGDKSPRRPRGSGEDLGSSVVAPCVL